MALRMARCKGNCHSDGGERYRALHYKSGTDASDCELLACLELLLLACWSYGR